MTKLEAPVYTAQGEQNGSQKLDPKVFGVAFNDALVHQVVVAQQANSRTVLAHTKGRGEVRGGGKKPWKQKGTGRARHGSRRSPIWVGGGITFGPTKERNFSLRINKKMKQQAIRMILSDKVRNNRLLIIEKWELDEPKTKKFHTVIQKLPSKDKKVTIITNTTDAHIKRASKNIPLVMSLGIGSLNAVDLLNNEYIIAPKEAVTTIEKRYL